MDANEIREGDEYRIVQYPEKYILYSGVSESDTDAMEKLKDLAMYVRAWANVPYTITLKIEKITGA